MNKHPISVEGFDTLNKRLRELKERERPAILDAVQKARDLGDLSENADYKTAKDQQRNIDSEIRRLESIVNSAEIIDVNSLSGDTVMFGATVAAEDGEGKKVSYRILSEYESDFKKNIIAITSPLGKGFVGKCVGDVCVIMTPSGTREFEIMEIKYGA